MRLSKNYLEIFDFFCVEFGLERESMRVFAEICFDGDFFVII